MGGIKADFISVLDGVRGSLRISADQESEKQKREGNGMLSDFRSVRIRFILRTTAKLGSPIRFKKAK